MLALGLMLGSSLALAGTSGGATSLLMQSGSGAGVAQGDYVSSAAGLNAYYSYFIEVPPGTSSLQIDIFDINLGGLHERGGDLDAAIAAYRHARDVDPKHFESRYNLGTLLLRKGQFKEAEATLREALALEPDHAYAHTNLGHVYLRLGWWQKALRQFQLLIRLDPEDANAHFHASRLLAAAQQVEPARKLLARAIELGGDEVRAAAHNEPAFDKLGIEPQAPRPDP